MYRFFLFKEKYSFQIRLRSKSFENKDLFLKSDGCFSRYAFLLIYRLAWGRGGGALSNKRSIRETDILRRKRISSRLFRIHQYCKRRTAGILVEIQNSLKLLLLVHHMYFGALG